MGCDANPILRISRSKSKPENPEISISALLIIWVQLVDSFASFPCLNPLNVLQLEVFQILVDLLREFRNIRSGGEKVCVALLLVFWITCDTTSVKFNETLVSPSQCSSKYFRARE